MMCFLIIVNNYFFSFCLQEDGNIEDDAEHGPEPFEVSGGTTMIEYLQNNPLKKQ